MNDKFVEDEIDYPSRRIFMNLTFVRVFFLTQTILGK